MREGQRVMSFPQSMRSNMRRNSGPGAQLTVCQVFPLGNLWEQLVEAFIVFLEALWGNTARGQSEIQSLQMAC